MEAKRAPPPRFSLSLHNVELTGAKIVPFNQRDLQTSACSIHRNTSTCRPSSNNKKVKFRVGDLTGGFESIQHLFS